MGTKISDSKIESAKINNLNIWKYINYVLEELPQLKTLTDSSLSKYLPWSSELPDDVRNYEREYEELKISE